MTGMEDKAHGEGAGLASTGSHLRRDAARHVSESEGVTEYTCPMHPEIRQPGPGSCPICGMALEPVKVTADSGPSAELVDMTRRFWIGVVLSVPVVLLEMGRHLIPPLEEAVTSAQSNWLQLVLATPVVPVSYTHLTLPTILLV